MTRELFLLHQTASILSESIIQEVIWRAFRHCFDAHWQEHFARNAEFLFLGASLTQLGARVAATLLFWAGTYCLLDAAYLFVSVLSVAFGFTQPHEWPPLFGSLTDAYSVRRFWGKFWHQLLRHPVIFFSKAATSAITRILPTSISRHQRTISLFLIFMASGLTHSLTDIQYRRYGLTDTFPVLRFFAASFLAFVLETAWIRVYRAGRSKAGKGFNRFYDGVDSLPGRVVPRLSVERMVGYMWVAAWICSLTPSLVYPPLRVLEHKASLLLQ
ncbi:membrane bound O-acyl transferase family-domain-containing protein [Aspergillus taichungensis]|uniref:Membrane bound O-acyl transferase family-domain-containing protein n=1 Tax=Aspergillus taichungensis TaxID=482145 RepID=A0A2J5I4E7_9EURO|nr:membrane bound O-acyl transferase family-domain-containing protein [Aspergillus taichungensis]